ncbi:hypothetical protein Tco_1258830 [Tanacetum coccineum]
MSVVPVCGLSLLVGLGCSPKMDRKGPLTKGLKRKECMASRDDDSSPKSCPWELYVAKEINCETWSVRTFMDEHSLQKRVVGVGWCLYEPGQLLSDVGFDSNSGIYPLAYAVVEAETKES